MHVHPDAAQHHLLVDVREAAGDRDNYGSVLSAHPDTRGGGQLQTAGSQPIETPACPATLSPEPPPGTRSDATPGLGRRARSASSWPYNLRRRHSTLGFLSPHEFEHERERSINIKNEEELT
jgi:hypothetical protein